jgi:hypothetical protein
VLAETREAVTTETPDGNGPSSPWPFAENIVKLAGLAYAFGFLIVVANTAKLGIPIIQVPEPVNVLIGAIPALLILFWNRYTRFLRSSFTEMNERVASMEARITSLSNQGQSDELWLRTLLELNRDYFDLIFDNLLLLLPMASFVHGALRAASKAAFKSQGARLLGLRRQSELLSRYTAVLLWGNKVSWLLRAVYRVTGTTLIIAGWFALYVWAVYPNVDQSFGGGRPIDAYLLINREEVPAKAAQLKGIFEEHRDLNTEKAVVTKEVCLLYTTADMFYVRAPEADAPIIALEREAVGGVIYSKSRKVC